MKNQPQNYLNKLRSACPKLFKIRMCTHHTGTLKKSPYNPALKSTGEQIFGQSKTCMGFPMFPTTMHHTVYIGIHIILFLNFSPKSKLFLVKNNTSKLN